MAHSPFPSIQSLSLLRGISSITPLVRLSSSLSSGLSSLASITEYVAWLLSASGRWVQDATEATAMGTVAVATAAAAAAVANVDPCIEDGNQCLASAELMERPAMAGVAAPPPTLLSYSGNRSGYSSPVLVGDDRPKGFVCAQCLVVIPSTANVYCMMDMRFCSHACRAAKLKASVAT
jgi:hypothetical protein